MGPQFYTRHPLKAEIILESTTKCICGDSWYKILAYGTLNSGSFRGKSLKGLQGIQRRSRPLGLLSPHTPVVSFARICGIVGLPFTLWGVKSQNYQSKPPISWSQRTPIVLAVWGFKPLAYRVNGKPPWEHLQTNPNHLQITNPNLQKSQWSLYVLMEGKWELPCKWNTCTSLRASGNQFN